MEGGDGRRAAAGGDGGRGGGGGGGEREHGGSGGLHFPRRWKETGGEDKARDGSRWGLSVLSLEEEGGRP